MTFEGTGLEGYSIEAIIVFALVMLFVIRPVKVPLPLTASRAICRTLARVPWAKDLNSQAQGRLRVHLNLSTVPTLGVLILLVSKAITFDNEVKLGIVGENGVKPFSIMILFLSLAYVSLSLDSTGLFRAAAFWVMQKSAKRETRLSMPASERGPAREDQVIHQKRLNGTVLYSALYFLFFVLSSIVGNDPIILSGTAFLSYLMRVADIDSERTGAWIMSEFWAANIGSMVLVVGNPTNLVVANAFGIDFAVYSAFMILPAIAAALCGIAILLLQFKLGPRLSSDAHRRSSRRTTEAHNIPGQDQKSYVPRILTVPSVSPAEHLSDKSRAIFGCVLLACTLSALIVSSFFEVDVWIIALPCGVVMLLRDVAGDLLARRKAQRAAAQSQSVDRNGNPSPPIKPISENGNGEAIDSVNNDAALAPDGPSKERMKGTAEMNGEPSERQSEKIEIQDAQNKGTSSQAYLAHYYPPRTKNIGARQKMSWSNISRNIHANLPTVMTVGSKMPWALVPFAFCMFILVQALQSLGWIDIFARWLQIVADRAPGDGVAGTIFFVGLISVFMCNIAGTNIGATILLAKVFQNEAFSGAGGPASMDRLDGNGNRLLKGALYALAFGSNVGAFSFSISASLAGLLWVDLLQQKGVRIRVRDFVRWNVMGIALILVVGLAIILAEVTIIY